MADVTQALIDRLRSGASMLKQAGFAFDREHRAMTDAAAALTTAQAEVEAEGFVVVPVEPTEAMMQAGWIASGPHPEEGPDDIYRAMIAARPQVEGNGND